MSATETLQSSRELAKRSAGSGTSVTLSWEPATNRTLIEISGGRGVVLRRGYVPRARAMDAFMHPFAYETVVSES
jgi:hypothetical protein